MEQLKSKLPEMDTAASFQWTETVGSSFPSFIPYENAVAPRDTIFYMHKFYETSMSCDHPNQFKFKVLPGDSKYYINEVNVLN